MNRRVATLQVNGQVYQVAVRPYEILLDTLREQLNLTGTRRGCDMGTCGCCTVILDGRPRLSCLTLTLEAEGKPITTVEGLSRGDQLHPVQEAFVGWGGSQCGFCTPGFIMTSVCLLEEHPDPSDEQIKEAIAGNMCRCTGYLSIVEAIRAAAAKLRAGTASGVRRPASGEEVKVGERYSAASGGPLSTTKLPTQS